MAALAHRKSQIDSTLVKARFILVKTARVLFLRYLHHVRRPPYCITPNRRALECIAPEYEAPEYIARSALWGYSIAQEINP